MKKPELFEEWQTLLINLSVRKKIGLEVWNDIEALYTADGRYYHTLDHIQSVLQTIAEQKSQAANYHALQLAAWFHDIIYNPRATNNEIQSVFYTESLLLEMSIPRHIIQKVSQMIVATGKHINPAKDPDTYILLDADLAILGSEPEAFRAYCQAIRKEYDWVPNPIYHEKRIEVLKQFLNRPQIYHTELLHNRLEIRARENLLAEIGRLS